MNLKEFLATAAIVIVGIIILMATGIVTFGK